MGQLGNKVEGVAGFANLDTIPHTPSNPLLLFPLLSAHTANLFLPSSTLTLTNGPSEGLKILGGFLQAIIKGLLSHGIVFVLFLTKYIALSTSALQILDWNLPKPSLKIRTASAIFWIYLGILQLEKCLF